MTVMNKVSNLSITRWLWQCTAITFSILSLVGCEPPSTPMPTLARQVLSECPSASSEFYYFQDGAISPDPIADQLYRSEYSRYLKAFNAPSLSCGTETDEAYRLLWIQNGHPEDGTIALSRHNQSWEVASVEYVDPRLIREAAAVHTQTRTQVPDDDAARLIAALKSSGFWATLRWEPSTANSENLWIIEGRTETGYHLVTRRSLMDATFKAMGVPFFTVARRPLLTITTSK
jgi:hypothetical protein